MGRAAAVLFGRPKGYSDAQKKELYDALKRVIGVEFERPELPVVANMDFGHTDPKIILPMGAKVQVDSGNRELTIVEDFTKQ